LAKHLIDFSLLKSLYLLISRYQFPFLFHLQVPQWFSFSLLIEAPREAFACFLDTYVSFQDLSFSKTPLFFRLVRLSYSATSIKISWIPFTSILSFLGFPTTFSSLVDTLKYIHSHYFLILALSMGCDPSQGYLTKEKNSLQLKLELQGTYSSIRDIKNGLSSFQIRLVRIDKFWPYYSSDLHEFVLQVYNSWKLHHLCFM